MKTAKENQTFSCINCAGTGTHADPYKEMKEGVYYGECRWCGGTGEVDHDTFNEQFIAFGN